MELADAIDNLEKALDSIGKLWRANPSSRTPRMADAFSLMERALGKLKKERDRPTEAAIRKPGRGINPSECIHCNGHGYFGDRHDHMCRVCEGRGVTK